MAELVELQLEDGGWSTSALLTDGKTRDDGQPLEIKTSDGYGTSFIIVVAGELGVPANDPRLVRGIEWLLSHQRESGKWFTRSPVRDCGNRISNTGNAYAILALQSGGKLPGWPFYQGKQFGR